MRSTISRSSSSLRRIADDDLEHEAVELGLGQRVGALLLDRVLRREDEEGLRAAVRLARDGDRRSCIASSSADCVFGARLISSARTKLAKIGPFWNDEAPAPARGPVDDACR
jgi:hypothetical protein